MEHDEPCPICCAPFTARMRRPISCPKCAYAACTSCVKTFLLSTSVEPHCMNCRAPWNREFLDTHLTRTWCNGPLKAHRGAMLFDRERSLLPTSQAAAAIKKAKRDAAAELEVQRLRLDELKDAIQAAYNIHYDLCQRRDAAIEKSDHSTALKIITELNRTRKAWDDACAACSKFNDTVIAPLSRIVQYGPPTDTNVTACHKAAPTFVAACPKADCRGFLNTSFKCDLCGDRFCKDCRELASADHTCNPDTVATIRAILADSRPCPRCGTAISRVSGCDQMFCTQCNTPFSYRTGEVVTGPIHNPHYFQRLQQLGGGAADCGNAITMLFTRVRVMASALPDIAIERNVVELRYMISDLQHRELPDYPDPTVPPNNEDLRVRYLLNDINDDEFKRLLARRDQERSRRLEIRAAIETAILLMLDTLAALPHSTDGGVGQSLFTQWSHHDWVNEKFRRYVAVKGPHHPATEPCQQVFRDRFTALVTQMEECVNRPLRAIADRYNVIVPQFVAGVTSAVQRDRYRPGGAVVEVTVEHDDVITHVHDPSYLQSSVTSLTAAPNHPPSSLQSSVPSLTAAPNHPPSYLQSSAASPQEAPHSPES